MPPTLLVEPPIIAKTPATTAEGRLLQRYRDGDQSAFNQLVERYHDDAVWTARRIVNDHDLAEDIAQDAFMRLITMMDRYQDDRPFRAWFLRIVHNLAIDHWRRHRREVTACIYDPGIHLDHAQSMERREVQDQVRSILATLPPRYRILLERRELAGERADAIAASTGIDYQTTRWRIHHARTLFRRAWQQRFGQASN